jgi:flagellar FliL protein
MADEDQKLKVEDAGKKRKLIFIVGGAVLVIALAVGAYFFFAGSDDTVTPEEAETAAAEESSAEEADPEAASTGTALYVAMPRPFIFNVPGRGRDRLVQIKVQLMVRGTDNEAAAKTHIPSIEGALLKVFSTSNADELVTREGKEELRERSVDAVQAKLQEVTGKVVVEKVLFTGFVMQ